MPSKVSMIFKLTTTANASDAKSARTTGWSESVWTSSTDFAAIEAAALAQGGLIQRRVGVLPVRASLDAMRIQPYTEDGWTLIPNGGALPVQIARQGAWQGENDQASMALLCSAGFTNHANRIRFRITAIPDAQVVSGEAAFSAGYRDAMQRYFAALAQGWGSWIDDRRTVVDYKIKQITADGVLTSLTPMDTLAANQTVKILRTRKTDGCAGGGVYKIASMGAGNTSLTLVGWDQGVTTGGTVRQLLKAFATFAAGTINWERVVRRKTGAPFDQPHGR